MNAHQIHTASYLDILFERRNKAYGSYELRSRYPARLKRALGAVFSMAVLFSSYTVVADMLSGPAAHRFPPLPKADTLAAIPPRKDIGDILPPPPAGVKSKFPNPTLTIAPDDSVLVDVPDAPSVPVSSTGNGSDPERTSAGMPGGSPDGTAGASTVGTAPEPPREPFIYVEQMPEFNGDLRAYLTDRVRYPDAAREAGIEGRVVLRFVVAEDGAISDVTVVRSVDGQLDAEAVRVVQGMPRWKPGRQNGRPVKVYFSLPVSFRLE